MMTRLTHRVDAPRANELNYHRPSYLMVPTKGWISSPKVGDRFQVAKPPVAALVH